MQRETHPKSAAIIGGGISGLAAALELVERSPDIRVEVFERDERPGGVLRTGEEDGILFELGPDSMLRKLPWGMDLCKRIGLSDQMVPTEPEAAGVYTIFDGRLVRMPEALTLVAPQKIWPMVRTPILSWRGKLRMAAERVLPRRRNDGDESLAKFARRRFGAEALQRIIQPMAGGIYMGDPELLGMQAAFPQLVAAEREFGSLIKWSRSSALKKKSPADRSRETLFTAPLKGFGQLVEAIASRLPVNTLRLNHSVEKLRHIDGRWRIQGEHSSEKKPFEEEFDLVVIASPARHASALVADSDSRLAELLSSIQYTSCVVINLAYPRNAIGHPLDASGIIVPEVENRAINACTFSSVKYRGRSPEDTALLRVFVGGPGQSQAIDLSDDALVESVCGELQKFLKIESSPFFQRIIRWRDTMPQYYVNHLQLVDEIESRVDRLSGLALTGNAYRGVGIPHCIHQAQRAVERLLNSTACDASNRFQETSSA